MTLTHVFRGLAAAACSVAALAVWSTTAHAQVNPAWPKNLTLGTASVGGTYFVYGQVWASLVNEKVGTNISTQQTQGPNQNIILTDSRQVDFGMTTMGVALQAWEGKGDWTKGKQFRNIRALFPMYDTPFHFVALEKIRHQDGEGPRRQARRRRPARRHVRHLLPADVRGARHQGDDPQRPGVRHGGEPAGRPDRRIPVLRGSADCGVFGAGDHQQGDASSPTPTRRSRGSRRPCPSSPTR